MFWAAFRDRTGMIAVLLPYLDVALLAFGRVSAFMMVLPGFASIRIPMRIRLYLALAVTLAITPLVPVGVAASAQALACELVTGLVLGLLVRLLFLAFGFAATAIANFCGIAAMPGLPIETEDAGSPVSALLTLAATAMVFAAGLHGDLIAGLAHSYAVLPVGIWLQPGIVLARYGEMLGHGFLTALRLMMPFLIFSIVVNMAIGLANKLSPQIPVYFISMPFVAAGGLVLLWALGGEVVGLFALAVRDVVQGNWF
jgi:flagellar biosynthesis protein FliR